MGPPSISTPKGYVNETHCIFDNHALERRGATSRDTNLWKAGAPRFLATSGCLCRVIRDLKTPKTHCLFERDRQVFGLASRPPTTRGDALAARVGAQCKHPMFVQLALDVSPKSAAFRATARSPASCARARARSSRLTSLGRRGVGRSCIEKRLARCGERNVQCRCTERRDGGGRLRGGCGTRYRGFEGPAPAQTSGAAF